MRVRPARPPCCPGRRPWPSASSARTPSIPRSAACRTPSCVRCRPARVRTLCTASRSASPPTLPWSGCRLAAGRPRSCSRRSAAPNVRPPSSSRPGSPAPPRRRPPAWLTGRRCTGTSSGSAWCTPPARPARPRCSSARWPPGPAAGPAYGRALSASGLTLATFGSYLGGHLALRLGAGTSHAEQVSHLAGLGWHDLCAMTELPDRQPVRRQLGYLSLLVYRQGPEVSVLSDRCSHLGGPLHQGRIVVERGTACVACPWHGSTFVMTDGAVVHGPATARQPSFETRVTTDGRVELRPRP